jgi:hypothetical protein
MGLATYTISEPSCSYDNNSGVVGLHVSLQVGIHTVLLKSLQASLHGTRILQWATDAKRLNKTDISN